MGLISVNAHFDRWGLQICIVPPNINRDVLSRQRYFCDCLYFCKRSLEMRSWDQMVGDSNLVARQDSGYRSTWTLRLCCWVAAGWLENLLFSWHVSWESEDRIHCAIIHKREHQIRSHLLCKLWPAESGTCKDVSWCDFPYSGRKGKYPSATPYINTGAWWEQLLSHWGQYKL